jgi:hypothetical protein
LRLFVDGSVGVQATNFGAKSVPRFLNVGHPVLNNRNLGFRESSMPDLFHIVPIGNDTVLDGVLFQSEDTTIEDAARKIISSKTGCRSGRKKLEKSSVV